jgi:hypothetical protein
VLGTGAVEAPAVGEGGRPQDVAVGGDVAGEVGEPAGAGEDGLGVGQGRRRRGRQAAAGRHRPRREGRPRRQRGDVLVDEDGVVQAPLLEVQLGAEDAGEGGRRRPLGRVDRHRREALGDDHVADGEGGEEAAEAGGAPGRGGPDGVADQAGGPLLAAGPLLLDAGRGAVGERPGDPVVELPPGERQRVGVAEPQHPDPAAGLVVEHGQQVGQALPRHVPAPARGRAEHGHGPDQQGGEGDHRGGLAPAEAEAREVDLEGDGAEGGGHGEGGGRHGQADLGVGGDREPAPLGRPLDQDEGDGHGPRPHRPGQAPAPADGEREGGGDEERPPDGGGADRAGLEAEEVAQAGEDLAVGAHARPSGPPTGRGQEVEGPRQVEQDGGGDPAGGDDGEGHRRPLADEQRPGGHGQGGDGDHHRHPRHERGGQRQHEAEDDGVDLDRPLRRGGVGRAADRPPRRPTGAGGQPGEEPRRRRVGDEPREAGLGQRVPGDGDGRVDHERDEPGPQRAERAGQPPGADQAEHDEAEHDERAQQGHVADDERAEEGEQPERRGGRRGGPEAGPAPSARPLREEVAGAVPEGGQVADGRHRAGQQVAAAAEQDDDDGGPHDDGQPGVAAPQRRGQAPAGGGHRPDAVLAGRAELAPQEGAQPGAAPELEAAQLPVAHLPDLPEGGPALPDLAGAAQVPGPRGQHVPGLAGAADGQPVQRLGQGQQHRRRQGEEQGGQGGADEEAAQAVAGLEAAAVVDRAPLGQRLGVAGDGRRLDDDPGPGQAGPPAQVEVLAVQAHARVEPAEGVEQVGPHQQAGARDGQHLAHGVVLGLVQLAPVHEGGGHAQAVGRQPDAEQPVAVVPGHELRADDAGVGAERLLDEVAHGVAVEGDVVVEEQQEVGALDRAEGLVGGRRVPRVRVQAADVGAGQARRDAGGQPVGAGRVDDEDGQVRVVLRRQPVEHVVEPGPGVAGDEDRDDRGGGLASGFHDRARVAGCPRRTGDTGRRSHAGGTACNC